MRIVHICNEFPPTVGGSETHNYSVVKYLSEKGHKVEVIVLRQTRLLKGCSSEMLKDILCDSYTLSELEGVTIHNLYGRRFRVYFDLWKKVREIEKKEGKADIIEVHMHWMALPFWYRKKVILSLHFAEFTCPEPHYSITCMKRSLKECRKCVGVRRYLYWRAKTFTSQRIASKIFVKTNYLRDELIKNGVSGHKVKVIPFWIDTKKFRSITQKNFKRLAEMKKNCSFLVGYLGRLNITKNLFMLLDAFNLFIKKWNDAKLLFLGDGDLRGKLEEYCLEHNFNNRVLFCGNIKHEEIPPHLQLPDVFVTCSNLENYNWSLLEVMASKKPIIATNVGGTKDILVDGYNALLIEPTTDSLYEGMEKIIKNPNLARKIAKNALLTVTEKHSLENLEKYERLLKEEALKKTFC